MATMSLETYLVHLLRKADQHRCELNRKKTMVAELRTLEFWRAIIAECLATFVYVFLVCGSHVVWPMYSINTLTKSFANGLAMATATHCFGHISGAHVNPAFTFAMLVTQKVTPLRAFLYVTAQCGGAIAGAALLYGVTVPGAGFRDHLGCTLLNESLSAWQGLGLELVLGFVVAFAMCAAADPNRTALGSDALAVGLAYLVCTLVALPATGASMNPARSLGPAFVSNTWNNHWIYWAGPVIGGVLAGLIYEYIFESPKKLLPIIRDREDSERDISDAKDDTESKSSSVLTPRTPHQVQTPPTRPYYRPLTPHETSSVRSQSRATYAPAAKYATSPVVNNQSQPPQQQQQVPTSMVPTATYYSTLPRGGGGVGGYRNWNEYSNQTQFKF